MKTKTKVILGILAVVCLGLIEELILLPLNLQAGSTWIILFVIAGILVSMGTFEGKTTPKGFDVRVKKIGKTMIAAMVVLVAFVVVQSICGPLGSAGYYAKRVDLVEGDFASDVEELNLNNISLVDKESAKKLGDRVMGNLPQLVSQFQVSDAYTQITYQGRLYRVTPLEYNGFFKWLGNNANGTPGYILVDSTSGEATLVQVEGGMHYVPSSYFTTDLARHIFNSYPTELLGTSVFEIDEEGNPYWITPVKRVRAIELATDIKGIVTTNAIDGTNTYYDIESIPEWVDHAFPSSVMEDKINSVLKYQGGFLNTLFAQSGVRKLTDSFTYDMGNDQSVEYTGYQYIGCNAGTDVCMYSGVTSAAADDSNLGFVLANLRTGTVDYYAAAGAEEYSAIDTARGATQEKGYTASFPILVNLDGRPTYVLSLKDDAGLVKAYALVDVQNYQKVSVTNSDQGIVNAVKAYRTMMGVTAVDEDVEETESKTVVVQEIHTAVVDGNTMYYILTTTQEVYIASIQVSDSLPFVKEGDTLKLKVTANNQITTME